jgi:hypothetical protein
VASVYIEGFVFNFCSSDICTNLLLFPDSRSVALFPGTLLYMAPELLEPVLSRAPGKTNNPNSSPQPVPATGSPTFDALCAADTYSFGLLLCALLGVPLYDQELEQLHKEKPARSVTAELLRRVQGGLRPLLPPLCPAELKSLITDSWQADAATRPSFAALAMRLQLLLNDDKGRDKLAKKKDSEAPEGHKRNVGGRIGLGTADEGHLASREGSTMSAFASESSGINF